MSTGRYVEARVHSALRCWESARTLALQGRGLRASVLYTHSFNHFLMQVRNTENANLAPIYHAFATMCREAALAADRRGTSSAAIAYSRAALAAAHFADPTQGRPGEVRNAVRDTARPMFHRVLGGGDPPPLGPSTLIGGAALARVQLVELLWRHRSRPRWQLGPQWPISSGRTVTYLEDQARYRRAVLPACSNKSGEFEMRLLATEGMLFFEELHRCEGGFESSCSRAMDILARVDGVVT